ncbi:MAG: hypothetical protein M3Y86_07765, partial [Verrucomicrobiota bacterium]|nr:hypothetical protein [Verrucomicrobiota bacterium]
IFDRLELRGSVFSMNNLNRGTSKTVADDYQNGVLLEARYYFGGANIYDTGRLNFISLGYYPEENLIGGAGSEFRAGLFAQAYLTYDIPALRSYLYANAKFIAEENVDPRLVSIDGGLAARPFSWLPNLELRVGDEFTADLQDDTSRNLVYGAIRGYFAGGSAPTRDSAAPALDPRRIPEIWGDIGLGAYAAGERMGANGVEFNPLFMSDFSLNFGLLPRRKIYLFADSQFWIQRESAAGNLPARDPANHNVSEREFDIDAGLAWNIFNRFELRGSVYAMSNLNTAGSANSQPNESVPTGYQDGGHAQVRYYLSDANLYDPARQSFVEVGYYPSHTLIGGDGVGFHPGAFGRAYLSYDLPSLRSYVFADGTFIAAKDQFREIIVNAGFAARPFARFDNFELRVGNEVTSDVQAETTRDLTYGAIRINFSTR